MQLIKSLFCWHGFDNRQRFITIILSSLLAFITLNASLSHYKLISVVILLFCSLACLATTQRRHNDAQFDKKWLLVPAGSFLMTGLMIVFIGQSVSYWLLLLPLSFSLLLLTYPSKSQRRYILGYSGPVNLSDFKQSKKTHSRSSQRVEPTLNSINVGHTQQSPHASTVENTTSTSNDNYASTNTHHKLELGESIRLALFSKINTRLTIAVIISFFVLVLVIALIFSGSTETESPSKPINNVQQTTDFQHKITLPDNFSIMLAANNAIVVHWQANVVENNEVWELGTAKGDKSCKTIEFNNEEPIRTYSVSTKSSGYYAYFSPLDTKVLIKNIAFKNNFSLCGYKFSLKGSQATLGKSAFYSQLIEY